MRVTKYALLCAGWVIWAAVAHDAVAASKRVDPNAVDTVPSPFRGAVISTSDTTLIVRGDVKVKNPSAGKGKETTESHTISFSIKPETTITRNGKPAQLKDVQKDEFVSVTFTSKKGSSLKHVTAIAVGKEAAEVPSKSKGEKKKKK